MRSLIMRKRFLVGLALLIGLAVVGRPREARACGGGGGELIMAAVILGGVYAGTTIGFATYDLTATDPGPGYGVAEAVVNVPLALGFGSAFVGELDNEYSSSESKMWLGAFTALHTTLAIHGMHTAARPRKPKRSLDAPPRGAPSFGPPGAVNIGRVRANLVAAPVSDGRSVGAGLGLAGSF